MGLERDIDPIRTRRLELIALSPSFVQAIVAGDPDTAARDLGAPVGRWLLADANHLVQLALGGRGGVPGGVPGLGRVIVLAAGSRRRAIGSIGGHGSLDERGQLEIGCRIHPAYRRRGFGAEAMTGFLDWVTTRLGLTRVLLAVPSPGDAHGLVAIEIESSRAQEPGDEIAGLADLLEGARRR